MANQVVGQLRDQADAFSGQAVGLPLGIGEVASRLFLGVEANGLGGTLGRFDDRLHLIGHLLHRRLDGRGRLAHTGAPAARFRGVPG